jgi:hypothetical protein
MKGKEPMPNQTERGDREMTPERRKQLEAEIDAAIEAVDPTPIPKPKVVAVDGAVIRDADVHISPADKRNSHYGTREVVAVRAPEPGFLRAGTVRINMAEYERQWHERQATAAVDRRQRQSLREADPMGVWGNSNGEEYR